MSLAAHILSIATSAAALGMDVQISFSESDDAMRAIAELPGAQVQGVIRVQDEPPEPWLFLTVDLRMGPFSCVWLRATHHRLATSTEMEAASRWSEQPGRRIGHLSRLP